MDSLCLSISISTQFFPFFVWHFCLSLSLCLCCSTSSSHLFFMIPLSELLCRNICGMGVQHGTIQHTNRHTYLYISWFRFLYRYYLRDPNTDRDNRPRSRACVCVCVGVHENTHHIYIHIYTNLFFSPPRCCCCCANKTVRRIYIALSYTPLYLFFPQAQQK